MREALVLLLLVAYGGAQHQFLKCGGSDGDCCDTHRLCKFWSQNGECVKNPKWMLAKCQLSCRVCPEKQATPSRFPQRPDRHDTDSKCSGVMPIEVETRPVFSTVDLRARQDALGCAEVQITADCDNNMCFHKSFRSIDGSCNNLKNPIAGAAFTPYIRLLPSDYDDGVSSVVGSLLGNRPNPREVSMYLLSSSQAINGPANSLVMQFGQFISHDITRDAVGNACTCEDTSPRCANIPRPPTDTVAGACITFARAVPVCGTSVKGHPREQYNENTAFIDASSVYSSDAVSLRNLREGSMLKTHIVNGEPFPPNNRRDTLEAGDDRSTLFLGLASLHTTFLRLHNNIAASLQKMNPHWDDDRVFQETRKIVGSIMQVIVYEEFLPALLGPIHARLVPPYKRYDPSVNPGTINEFVAASYRLHGMLQETYPLLGPNFENMGEVPVVDGVGRIEQVLSNIDAVYRGFIATPSRYPQRITTSVTELLLGGKDMATTNNQRGRDHGLRPYNDYRKLCHLKPIRSFEQWPEVTVKEVRERVAELYKTPDDVVVEMSVLTDVTMDDRVMMGEQYQNFEILLLARGRSAKGMLDLYVGGILEEPIEGGFVGPTFACIIAEQFVRLRDGDRFYFENKGVFTPKQLHALKAVTLSWVLCETSSGLTRIVPNAFMIDDGERAVPCSSLPKLNLSAWKD